VWINDYAFPNYSSDSVKVSLTAILDILEKLIWW
jgi:hypothetical protein